MSAAAVHVRRLFFALWPDAALREALRRETRARAAAAGGRAVPPADWHLTLAFLGNVADEQLPLLSAAARALAAPPLALRLDCYGWFEAAQVFWIGCSAVPPALGQLARELAHQAGEVAGLRVADRPFHPHVTLARKVRNPPGLAPPRGLDWVARGWVLAESVAEADGPRYRVLAEFPLSA